MKRGTLGRSGAQVGVIGLGTSPWGRGTDRIEAREQVAMLLEAGGSVIDIDPQQTDPAFLREAVVEPGRRAEAFVVVRTRASGARHDLLGRLDANLASMSIGHADMWLVEGWDGTTSWQELASALAVATATGRAMYVGLRATRAWHAAMIGAALQVHPDRPELAALAVPYSLLDLQGSHEMVGVAEALDTSVIAVWPLAGGVLTGKYRHATPPDSRGAGERYAERIEHYRQPWARPVVDALCAAAEGLGLAPGALALAWARERPLVSCLVVGARTTHQWRAALDSAEVAVPSEIGHVLDEVAAQAHSVGQDGFGG